MNSIIKKCILFLTLFFAFTSHAQEADTTVTDFASNGLKVHAFLMNITDVAKVTGQNKPFLLGVNGVQITS